MATLPKRFYTLEEYFDLDRESDLKYEYWNGEVFCMTGSSPEHALITANVIRLLGNQLVDRNCRVLSGDIHIKVPAAQPYRYADASVYCGKMETEEIGKMKALVNPVLIVEVLSPSTERFDRTGKFTFYQSIPSFREYLLIAQDKPCITQHVKRSDGNWEHNETADIDSVLHLPSLDCSLALNEVYEGIDF